MDLDQDWPTKSMTLGLVKSLSMVRLDYRDYKVYNKRSKDYNKEWQWLRDQNFRAGQIVIPVLELRPSQILVQGWSDQLVHRFFGLGHQFFAVQACQINLGLHNDLVEGLISSPRGNPNQSRVIVMDIEHTNSAKSGRKAVFSKFLRQKLIIFRKEKNGKVMGLVPKGPDSCCGHQRRFVLR